jgi:hypothetical protein
MLNPSGCIADVTVCCVTAPAFYFMHTIILIKNEEHSASTQASKAEKIFPFLLSPLHYRSLLSEHFP